MSDQKLDYLSEKHTVSAQRDIALAAIKYGGAWIAIIIIAVTILIAVLTPGAESVSALPANEPVQTEEGGQSQTVVITGRGKKTVITQKSTGGGNNIVISGDNAQYREGAEK